VGTTLDEAERILVPAYGSESLEIAKIHTARGTLAFHVGHSQAAVEHFERALAIREAVLEPDHPSIAVALSSLASARLVLGELTDARALLTRALELRRRKLGSQHPLVADALSNLGVVEFHIGDVPSAREHLLEALDIRRTMLPANHPNIASTLVSLGDVFRAQREFARALASYDEVVQMKPGDGESFGREQGSALSGRGIMHFDLGEMAKARADLEAALATPWIEDPDPGMRCEVHYKLARALVATGGDDARARELARTAAQECRAAGERGTKMLGELSAWARDAMPGIPSP
jgi:serine/threonine-protein kinase